MLGAISVEFAITLILIAVGIIGWEWKKVLRDKTTEDILKKEIASLREEMKDLHSEHQKLLTNRDGEHSDLMRNMTNALQNLNNGISELTHYIKWLGTQQTGRTPPPPLGSFGRNSD